jgi:hypothetical protein
LEVRVSAHDQSSIESFDDCPVSTHDREDAFYMADFDDRLSVTLPDALRQQFAQVERRLWRVETTVAICAGIGGLMVSFLAMFVSDRLWETPAWLRLALFLCGLAVAGLAGLEWARRWVWQRRDLKALANLVQRKYRRLGDRLLGIVELANEERHFANFSPALYHAAIYQVAEEAKSYDFGESVNPARARKSACVSGALAVVLLVIFVALPRPGWNAFLRWAAPMAQIPRYTLVRLDGFPPEMIVARGEGFDVSGVVHYRSFWKPREVFARWAMQQPVEGETTGETIHLHVPGQVEDGTLRIELGDARAQIKVSPIYRPSLEQLSANIQLPDYLKYPAQTNLLQNGALLMVEGSRVAFNGKVSRVLSNAVMQTDDSAPAPLKIAGENFSTDSTEPPGAEEVDFNWRDKLGLSNAAPVRVSIRTQADEAPTPEIVELPREIAMLDSDVLHVPVQARDDFGVRDFGLMWDMTADSPRTDVATTEIKTQTASPHITSAQKVFLWSPSLFRIPADSTVELQAYARDYYPDRERSMTPIYRIHVLSQEQHAEMVREQLEAVMEQVEEVTRLQEKIVANLAEVKDAEKMPEPQKSARIGQSKSDQLENAEHLDELSKEGERAVREAMKNPIFNEETIRQWSQSMDQWRQLSKDKMQDAAKSMQAARQSGQPQSKEMADASQKAEDILKQLEKMQGKANEHMDDLQALTLSQRLRKVGTEEKDIGGSLVSAAPETIGLLPRDLPEKYKVFENDLTRNQAGEQKETAKLQGEISRFFERTQKTNYGEVSQEMKSSNTVDELGRLGGLIGNNIGIEASDNLGQWSDRFQKWSEKLEPKSNGKGQGSGSGSSSQKKDDLTEQLIALLRLRESEMNLHDQTAILDQDKGRAETYPKRAVALSQEQEKLAGTLDGIHQKTPIKELDPAFAQVNGAMKNAATILRQPQTGKPADDAEMGTIEALSDLVNLINEQAQRPNPQQSQSQSDGKADEEMQFLLQMMRNSANAKAMAAKPATGLNQAGGSTDRRGRALSGNAAGKGAGSRNVQQAGGTTEEAPAEFREALENYYHGIEEAH